MKRISKPFTLALGAGGLAVLLAGAAVAQQHMGGGMAPHDPFGNATITRAEAQAKAGEMFAKMDLNGDGKLDQADRAAALGKRFDMMDANHDGALSKQEFIDAHQQARAAMGGAERPGMMPGMMKEPMMGHMGGHMGGGRMLGAMDANGDRAISRDEFVAGALKRFDAADANHDGKLTAEERRAAFRAGMKMHGQHRGGHGMEGHDMDDMPPPPAR